MDKVVESLISLLQSFKTDESKGNKKNFVIAAVVAVLALVVTGVLAFVSWRRGRKLAQLRHDLALKEEEAHQEEVAAELAKTWKEKREALARANSAKARIQEIEREKAKVEKSYAEVKAKIDSITSWDDVDDFLSGEG